MQSLKTKRDGLADFIREKLLVHSEGWRVDTRLRSAVIFGGTRNARTLVMGDPVRYVVIQHTGMGFSDGEQLETIGGISLDSANQFSVQIWHEWFDAEFEEDSSQWVWDKTLLDETDGLLYQLQAEEWLESASSALGKPSDIVFDVVELGNSGRELAHFVSFTITVT